MSEPAVANVIVSVVPLTVTLVSPSVMLVVVLVRTKTQNAVAVSDDDLTSRAVSTWQGESQVSSDACWCLQSNESLCRSQSVRGNEHRPGLSGQVSQYRLP